MNNRLARLEKEAITFIRNAENLALRMDERGFHVAFSGGKDSQVMLALVEMAGVKHHAEMQVTSVDPPNLMRFVRKYYPQVKLNLPKLNMRQLIVKKKMLPTRIARFCCAELKEHAGAGCVTCIGIRAAESTKRAKRHAIEVSGHRIGYNIINDKLVESTPGGEQLFDMDSETKVYCVNGKDKVTLAPIFHWTDADVWVSSRNTNCLIATYTTRVFTALAVCFARCHNLQQNAMKWQCSHLSPKGFILRQSENLWQWANMTVSILPNKSLNGGFPAKV